MAHGLVVGVWARFSPSQALVMKTSVFHNELAYITRKSEIIEQWPRQTAPCVQVFLAILVNLRGDLLFFGANPPRWPLHCHAIPINC